MSGITRPKFLEGVCLPNDYYAEPDPYRNVKPNYVDLLSMSRYANKHGKKLIELTKEEVQLFLKKP